MTREYLAADWASPTTYMDLVNQAASSVTGTDLDFSDVGSALANRALVEAAEWSVDKPLVRVTRARGAAMTDYGYRLLAAYERWRPTIFATSAAVCGLSLGMGYVRRRIPEGWVVYGILAGVSGTLAWFTRPDAFRPPPAPLPPSVAGLAGTAPPKEAPGALARFLGWLDRRVQLMSTEQPGWEAQTYSRLSRDLGFGTMSPAVRVLLTQDSL